MSTIDSIKNALFSFGKKTNNEDLVIPLEGYDEENEEHAKKRFYGFKLNELQLLLDANVRSEVLNQVTITPIPLMPKFIKGLCNVRGNLVPVYDLYEKFGLDKSARVDSTKQVLVLDENKNMAAIEIDEMITSLEFDEQDMQTDIYSQNEQFNQLITYSYKHNDDHWYGFNHKKLFQVNI